MRWLTLLSLLVISAPVQAQRKPDGNRLAYLDELDPYYPHKDFPKLITPQWVGDKDVECVVVLAIDDMRDPKKYETYLRPILRRLKDIDGRAPVSIMTCSVKPDDPQLQDWLKEGLSLECHTVDHPCPFFKNGFAKAKDTYDRCIDLMSSIPNNKPVAFRMPCCDSLNTPSPRFWAEIFNKTTDKGKFLTIDSSVFNVFTSADPELPRELVLDEHGQERFTKYLPRDRSFVNTIENYPYPYVIGRLCWEFPCVTPSDWEAQHLQKPNNPITVRDMKAALDCAVVKKGVFCLVFHPHGWIRSDQVVDLIDHAVAKHGRKVKFLTFKEAQDRLNKNLLRGVPIREGSAVLDVDHDGFMDVLLERKACRLWDSGRAEWKEADFGVHFGGSFRVGSQIFISLTPLRLSFGVLGESGHAALLVQSEGADFAHDCVQFDGQKWIAAMPFLKVDARSLVRYKTGKGGVIRMLDLDQDGRCELIVRVSEATFLKHVVLRWSEKERHWRALPFELPNRHYDPEFLAFLQLRDLDGDGKLDILFSNEQEYGIYLFTDMQKGWSKKVTAGRREDNDALPMISRKGTDNGFWVHSGHLWWSNEDTPLLKDHVDRRSIKQLLKTASE